MSACDEPLWWNQDGSVKARCNLEPCYRHVRKTLITAAQCDAGPTCQAEHAPDKATSALDMVNHPPHYKGATVRGKRVNAAEDRLFSDGSTRATIEIEPADVVEAFGLDKKHFLASVLYYIVRAGKKGDEVEDLKKARWFLDREIARVERGRK